MTKAINRELVVFIRRLREHLDDSHLAKILETCSNTLHKQNEELTHLYQENDELRQRLVKAQQGLIEARDALLQLRGE